MNYLYGKPVLLTLCHHSYARFFEKQAQHAHDQGMLDLWCQAQWGVRSYTNYRVTIIRCHCPEYGATGVYEVHGLTTSLEESQRLRDAYEEKTGEKIRG